MKHMKVLSILMLSAMAMSLMTSCSKSAKLEKAAKEQMEATFKEMARDPSSVSLSNIETVYSDDSLCILHCDFSAKNGLGAEVKDKCEYIFISSNGKNYESYMEISKNEEGVFVSPEKYDKEKKGTIYEPLSYEAGLRYLAAIYVNGKGREAGVKDGEEFCIPVPTGTGSWELRAYQDEFGEKGSQKYLLLMGSGVFSNSATTNSRMTAILYMDKDDFSFKLIEYDSSVVKTDDSYRYRIKDSDGDVYEMTLYNSDSTGQMSSWGSEDMKKIEEILAKGGTITVSVKERNAYSTPDTYLFKLNVEGYAKAKSFLK
ncbi:hypothetical protein [Prevotella sp. P6B4]|uniref:hypothetical protein n=1 Tax=Prevotella sp. P6B4 TaxID=1410614 RepID=UPI00048F35BF|nr:hypothetical protein [Prevotella sp. P6B4]